MRTLHFLPIVAVVAASVACTPQSAHQANADLVTTSQEAAGASTAAKTEREKMAALTKDIQFDIKNLKEIEAFFDNDSRIIAFE